MTEALKDNPEQVVAILNEYLELTASSVFNNGGSVDKFIGDATMALFNGFVPLDDYVYKAVKTAWDMVRGAEKVNASIKKRLGVDVGFGIGVHCGIQAAEGDGAISSHMPDLDPFDDDLPIQKQYEYLTAQRDLQGPLLEELAISGRLAGQLAAIKIENDAHVATIAIQGEAVIAGDIVSEWARNSWGGDYATTISFGQTESGGAMRMDGDIIWSSNDIGAENSLDIEQRGGHLSYNGAANVAAWQIDAGASLGGNSAITLDGPDPFLNAGRIAPGDGIGAITINGNYAQSASGDLFMEFTPTATDRFIVNGNATIDPGAGLMLQALPAFYATNSQRMLTDAELFDDTLEITGFTPALLPLASPTLTAFWTYSGTNPVFCVTRAADAYSQYASGPTGSSVGKALADVVAHAVGDMQNLFAAIDFSHSGGAGVRSALRQLAPTAYDNTAKASLQAGHALSGLLLERLAASGASLAAQSDRGVSAGSEEEANSAFIQPFGGYFGQNAQGDNQGFDASFAGLIGGINRHFEKGLAGMHAAMLHRETSNRSDASAYSRANSIHLGVHGSLYPGEDFFISGLANAGLENTRMTRNVAIDAYHRKSHSEYTAVTAQSAVRAGYAWQNGNTRFGPLAGLDYAFYHRPPGSETGGQATRLDLDAANFHSLRSAVGGQVRTQMRLADKLTLQAGLSVQWMHELLDTSYGSTASFRGHGGSAFSVANRTDDHDALAIHASAAIASYRNLTLNAYVGTEFFRKRSNSVQGGLSIGWSF
jgi:uncharacterized protein with beta-barrel porin domain